MMNDLAAGRDLEVRLTIADRTRTQAVRAPVIEQRRCDRATALRRFSEALRLPLRTRVAARAERVCTSC